MSEPLRIKRLTLDAIVPTRASPGSVGYDLYSLSDVVIEPHTREIISTGICATIPLGCYGRIAPRSGLSIKYGIHVGAGVIDPDYTGELKVVKFEVDPINHASKLSLVVPVLPAMGRLSFFNFFPVPLVITPSSIEVI